MLLYPSLRLYILNKEFNLFTFQVIDMWDFVSIILLFSDCLYILSFPLSYCFYCGLVVFCSGTIQILFLPLLCLWFVSAFYTLMCFHYGKCNVFTFKFKILLIIYFNVSLVVMNSFTIVLSENDFTCPFMKDNFVGYSFPGWQFILFFQHFAYVTPFFPGL